MAFSMMIKKGKTVAKPKNSIRPLCLNTLGKRPTKKPKKLKVKDFQILVNPQKILEDQYYYKIRDVYICDHIPKNDIKSLMGGIKDIKKVVSFFYDKEYNLIICNLLDNLEGFPPIKLLIHRLQSLGDSNAYNLSRTLNDILHITTQERKITKKRDNMEDIRERKSYNDYLGRTENLINKFTHDFPIIFWRDSNFDDQYDFQLIQIGFNTKLMRLLGEEDPEKFGMKLLRKGIPDILWIKKEYFEMINYIMRSIFFPMNEKEDTPQFFIKTEKNLIMTKSNYHGNMFDEDSYVELSVVEVLQMDEKCLQSLELDSKKLVTEKKDEILLSNIKNFENRNLLINENNFRLDTEKWIKDCYPNFKITVLPNEQSDKKMRCGYKNVD